MRLSGLWLLILWASCAIDTRHTEKPGDAETSSRLGSSQSEALGTALSEFNRGAALLEQYKYVDAAASFERVMTVAPHWSAARFNLGLAYLNMQENVGASDSLSLAQKAFEEVLASEPNHLHARFCLGL
ncbi:MAG: hypothetical protein GY809_04120, partial [Planctomycetes bacterium]|nr:hypothetical protein [Planctomycetota bacterium]